MGKPAVGMIGLGIMGGAMSANLLKGGFPVVGYDIDPAMAKRLAGAGGTPVGSPAEVAGQCDLVVTSLPSAKALDAVIGGAEGLLAARRKGVIVAECSTLTLEDKQRARDALASGGMTTLDCPLSGTGAQALSKDLVVYASGSREAYDRFAPAFEGFARSHVFLGEFGNGSKMKFVANLLVAIHNVAAAEAMVLGMKAGLEPEQMYQVIGDGAGSSRMFQVRGPMMVNGRYDDATMKVEVWQKDMRIIGDFARSLSSPTPMLAASAQIYNAALAQGRAKEDTASVCAVMEEMAGFKRK